GRSPAGPRLGRRCGSIFQFVVVQSDRGDRGAARGLRSIADEVGRGCVARLSLVARSGGRGAVGADAPTRRGHAQRVRGERGRARGHAGLHAGGLGRGDAGIRPHGGVHAAVVMSNWIQTAMAAAGSGGAWALPALALATLVSEDLACIAAGLLVARGTLEFAPAATACFAGIFAGDLLLVLLGRGLGRTVLTRWPLRGRVSAEALARSERWFARRGASLILASRFMPGTRLPTYVAAGVLRMPVMKFIGWFALACALWTPLLVLAAMLAGEAALGWFETWQGLVPAVLLAGLAAWLLMRLAAGLATWRGRRLLLSRWRRLTRWEFWPAWAVYPPVVVYILWLGLRHRGWTLFTAVNPGMGRDGGFVGESKSMILRGLAGAG